VRPMNRNTLIKVVNASLEQLYAENMKMIVRDVAERTLCARLAAILQHSFDQHDVHAEYNRQGVDVKEVELPDSNGVLTSSNVSPDIIVHQVGHNNENMLVIEAKKTTNAEPDKPDLIKLAQIKAKFGYKFAVFLRLPAGPKADATKVRLEWVE
jgi:hypothetical protein